jgi:pantetheine-phosphate adenylyltransferase
MTAALIPGSFDPFHNGHLAVTRTAAALFDRVVIGVGHNPAKPSGLFSAEERREMVEASVADLDNVEVAVFTGLVTAAATDLGVDCLVKGVRGGSDLDAELVQANTNAMTGGTRTLLVPAIGAAALVASRYLREIGTRGGDISPLVPEPVWRAMQRKTGALGQ